MSNHNLQTIVLGGGCFWCTEAIFQPLKGVIKVTSGYAGGMSAKPNYEQVVSGVTGHAEVIKVEFDPSVISLKDLLEVFFELHDPTSVNRQDFDTGPMYRSMVLSADDGQKKIIEDYIIELNHSGKYAKPIVTQVMPLDEFYPAEKYHQNFYQSNSNNMYCQVIISPKLKKLRQKFSTKLR